MEAPIIRQAKCYYYYFFYSKKIRDGSLGITLAMLLDVAEIRQVFCEKRAFFFSRLSAERIFLFPTRRCAPSPRPVAKNSKND